MSAASVMKSISKNVLQPQEAEGQGRRGLYTTAMLGFWGTDQALYLPSERQRGKQQTIRTEKTASVFFRS